jgi:hypothetical protein
VDVKQVEVVGDSAGLGPDLLGRVAAAHCGEDQLELAADPVDVVEEQRVQVGVAVR